VILGKPTGKFRNPGHLTVAELAAFLSLKPATIRSLILRHEIKPVGKEGRANLYAARPFVDTVGGHDRRFVRKRRTAMQQ
jgi:hypothetical protein